MMSMGSPGMEAGASAATATSSLHSKSTLNSQ